MKRIYNIALCILGLVVVEIVSFAQTVQLGSVKEYKESMKKSPLGGVELLITNAPTTVTDKKGNFSLHFQTLKPGQKVNIRRIEKLGYEIFNIDALQQWNINPEEPFTIVMVKSERFKQIRDNYSRLSSKSYEDQFVSEKARLQKEFDEGRLTVDSLRMEICRLHEEYDRQLDNLDNYIDRFARIDVSELSKVEQEIIDMVQSGNIDAAIRKYDQLNLLESYSKSVSNLNTLLAAQKTIQVQIDKTVQDKDILSAQVLRNIRLLELKGGRESFAKIGQIYRELIAIDSTNFYILDQYVTYCINQNFLDEAIATLQSMLKLPLDDMQRSSALNQMGSSYMSRIQYRQADSLFNMALEFLNKVESAGSVDLLIINEMRSTVYNNLGAVFTHVRDFKKSEDFLLNAHRLREDLCAINPNVHYNGLLASTKHNLANLYTKVNLYDKAIPLYQESVDIYKKISGEDNSYIGRVANTINDFATCYQSCLDYNNSELYYNNAIDLLKPLAQQNPNVYNETLAMAYNHLGALYNTCQNFEKAIDCFKESDAVYASSEQFITPLMSFSRAMMYNNWANSYVYLSRIDAARDIYLHAADAMNSFGYADSFEISYIYNNLGTVEQYMGDFDASDEYYRKCLDIQLGLYNNNPKAYCVDLGSVQMNLGILHSQYMDDQPVAREYFDQAILTFTHACDINPNFNVFLIMTMNAKAYSYVYEKDYMNALCLIDECIKATPDDPNIYDSKGEILFLMGSYDEAIKMWEKVLELNPDFLKTTDSKLFQYLESEGLINNLSLTKVL